MATVPVLTAGVANAPIPSVQQIANAPFTSDPTWGNFFTLGWNNGNSSPTQQVTTAQVALNPAIFVTKTAFGAAQTVTLNLPNPATCRGSRMRIEQVSAPGANANLAITCTGGALFSGAIFVAGVATGNAAALTTITFTPTSALADVVELQSNGEKWVVRGRSTVANAVTFA